MSWDEFYIDKSLVGERVESGRDYRGNPLYVSHFILLPPNNVYATGYGFYLSAKLVDEEDGHIKLSDDYKVELQMSPSAREPDKRYKRYKLSGAEIKEQVFTPFAEIEAQREKAKAEARDKRNRRVMGSIVYGKYTGNHYGDQGDLSCDYFFFNGSRYYSRCHEKVSNVRVSFTVIENASKYFFDANVESIEDKLRGYVRMLSCIEQLRAVAQPDGETKDAIAFLQKQCATILKRVQTECNKEL